MSKKPTAPLAAGHAAAAGTTTPPALRYLPLPSIMPGHKCPTGDINARQYGRDDADDLIPSIKDFGVIVPFVVKTVNGVPYAVEGNRRLVALDAIYPKADRGAVLVPTIEAGKGDPLEIAMAVNVIRRDLHPVDQFEVFHVMVQAGATIDDIARRYLMKVPQVRQALSLAKLSPAVRGAWRSGKIGDEVAEAFTLTTDHAAQDKVLKRTGKGAGAYHVRQMLGAERNNVGAMLKLVGHDAYEKAGHHVNATLFSDEDRSVAVSDASALKVMADEKMADRCAALVKEGWGWALTKDKAPGDVHSWRRVYPTSGERYAKGVMAEAGCVVTLEWDGRVTVQKGYVKPGSKIALPKGATQTPSQRDAAKKKQAARAKNGPAVTNALALRLSRQITLAAADVLKADASLSLCVAIAALACDDNPTDVHVTGDEGWRGGEKWRDVDDRGANEFAKYLDLAVGKAPTDRVIMLAHWVAQTVNVVAQTADNLPLAETDSNAAALLKAMEPAAINAALRKRFDAKDYFASMSADAAKAALVEMDKAVLVPFGAKKAQIAESAAAAAINTGWLPPAMRIPAVYDGPLAKPKPKASPAKKKAAAKTKAKRK